jgi:CopA family copper-resistance protein
MRAILHRRRFVQGIATAGAMLAFSRPALAMRNRVEPEGLTGDRFDLVIDESPVNITGRPRMATAVNGSLPAPTLRFREGDTVTINVTNRLSESTSVHWHGIRLPADMDGVPGLTFRGIRPGETFTYRFPIVQSGTYWYHSHSGMQEQTGLYGPLILEPRSREPYAYDRDYVVVLSDWTDEDPMTIVSNLKQQSDYYNFHRRTVGTFVADVRKQGLGPTVSDRLMWGGMRMSPTDIMDVTGATYTFLINGQPPAANWTALFKPGERVRLRFINSASMSTFDVRIPELPLRIVQADGTDIEPVEVDEFRIGVAETYDVIVAPRNEQAYTIFAQAQDRTGYARATLAPRPGMSGVIPPMDPRPMRNMTDMGMGDMAGMDMGGTKGMSDMEGMPGMDMTKPGTNHDSMPGMDHGSMPGMDMSKPGTNHGSMPGMDHGSMPGMDMSKAGMSHGSMPGMDHGSMPGMDHKAVPGMGAMDMSGPKPPTVNADGVDPKTLSRNPEVDNVAMSPKNRLAEAGDGLDGNGRRVLTYAQLKALRPTAHSPPVQQEIEFHLTGNMERWVWGFDGKKFSEAGPVHVKLGERVRFVLINDTMMEHPIHLHGFLFAVENSQGDRLPLKHTINVKPGERMSFLYTADTPGHWAFHCHLLFHMETGMFRTVVVA